MIVNISGYDNVQNLDKITISKSKIILVVLSCGQSVLRSINFLELIFIYQHHIHRRTLKQSFRAISGVQ